MNLDIGILLLQDGVTSGAIYALLALALVLVFSVTRIIFVPQGEFVALGALTLASLESGKMPGTVWLLAGAGALAFLMEAFAQVRGGRLAALARPATAYLLVPLLLGVAAYWIGGARLPLWANVLVTAGLIVPLGPLLYRVVYQPLEEASVLVLLIASVGLHYALIGIALILFGPEGMRVPPFAHFTLQVGGIAVSAQTLLVLSTSAALIVLLYLFFGRTLYGKALRATAVNRRGARLVGISTKLSGNLSLGLAALIGALSGILIAPITTIYYDSGFLIALKGFVGAILGALASYPVAAAGAVLVGALESFSSYWASAFKEVLVFTLIIPVLLWRSFTTAHAEEEE